jgi:hypothetical protein
VKNAQNEEDTDRMLRRIERLERVRAGVRRANENGFARLGRGQKIEQGARERHRTV